MNWRSRTLTATVLLSLIGAVASAAQAAPAAPMVPAAINAKRVFMVSDSVGLGAKTAMPAAFPSDWSVTVTGKPGLFVEQLAAQYVQYQPLSAFGENAIVAGGYNYPYWDPARFDRSIDTMVNILKGKGVKRIFWVTVREITPSNFSGWGSLTNAYKTLYSAYPTLNNQLRSALLRHPQLSLIDWADVSDRTGITYDGLHLNPTGARLYSQIAANAVVQGGTRKPAGTTTEILVAGTNGVPADAVAVSLNLTSSNSRRSGFVSAYPCGGSLPVVSNLNVRPAQTVASAAIVPIGVGGKVCVFQSTDSHVIVDVNGSFGPSSGFIALTPGRAIDTRLTAPTVTNTPVVVHLDDVVGAPTGAFNAVVNLTVIGGTSSANVWLYACSDGAPFFPSRAINPGRVQNLTMVAETDANGDVCIKTSKSVHVIVDLFGAFPLDADLHAIPAQRLVDTRFTGGAVLAGTRRTQQVLGLGGVPTNPQPSGVVITLTLVNATDMGFATVFPCTASVPLTSVINVVANREQSNAVVTSLDAAGAICVYSNTSTHVLLDVSGWSGTAFTPMVPVRFLDTRIV